MHGYKFFMVLVDDTRCCSKKHSTKRGAKAEAERLVRLPSNQDKGATILEAIEYCKIEYYPITWQGIKGGK